MENTAYKSDTQAEQLRLLRLQTRLIACILIIILAAGIFLAYQFVSISRCVDMIEYNLQALDADKLNIAVKSFTDAANQFSSIDMNEFNKTVSSLQYAAKNFSSVDMDVLNDAVVSLKNAAAAFEDVDTDALNSLVNALETVATKLETSVNAFTRIFGR